jgi:hypothetical protein
LKARGYERPPRAVKKLRGSTHQIGTALRLEPIGNSGAARWLAYRTADVLAGGDEKLEFVSKNIPRE